MGMVNNGMVWEREVSWCSFSFSVVQIQCLKESKFERAISTATATKFNEHLRKGQHGIDFAKFLATNNSNKTPRSGRRRIITFSKAHTDTDARTLSGGRKQSGEMGNVGRKQGHGHAGVWFGSDGSSIKVDVSCHSGLRHSHGGFWLFLYF